MSAATHRQFFGDAEREFALPFEIVGELERVTGTGIGALVRRVMSSDFSLSDLHQIIRLALVGGGTDPKEAASLLAAYVHSRPIEEAQLLALNIVSAAYFGTADKENQ